MGTSTRPVLLILPERANTLVPGLFSVPKLRNQSAPWKTMAGTLARVSTLLMMVGQWNRPDSNGKGGFWSGSPRRPSTEFISAVSSPQTNAPAPMRISRSKLKSEPRMFSPSSPASRA